MKKDRASQQVHPTVRLWDAQRNCKKKKINKTKFVKFVCRIYDIKSGRIEKVEAASSSSSISAQEQCPSGGAGVCYTGLVYWVWYTGLNHQLDSAGAVLFMTFTNRTSPSDFPLVVILSLQVWWSDLVPERRADRCRIWSGPV